MSGGLLQIEALFQGLRSGVLEKRIETLEHIASTIRSWVKSSPRLSSNNLDTEESLPTSIPQNDLSAPDDVAEEAEKALELHLLTILRMSISCPYADVRHALKKILKELTSMGVSIPSPIYPYPSMYIPPRETYTLEWSREEPIGIIPDENIRNLMADSFIDIGRLSNYYRTLFYFPTFTKKFQNTYKELMKSQNGALPESYRYYIGIMAASQHKCQYLVSYLKNEYLIAGGNAEWLNGLKYASAKIKKIAKINSILAHQPWCLRADHIGELSRGDNLQDNWKIQEVIHIIVLLSTFHSMSSYMLCCGIVPECDSVGGYENIPLQTLDCDEMGTSIGLNSPEQTPGNMGSGLGIHVDANENEGNNDHSVEEGSRELPEGDPVEEDGFASCDETFSEPSTIENTPVITQNTPTTPAPISADSSPVDVLPPVDMLIKDFPLYLDPEVEVPYSDFVFVKRDRQGYQPHRTPDFNWETHGIVMINDHHLKFGDPLDEELKEIRSMNDSKLSSVDDSSFREAIWYYVYRLYGIQKDDYNYRGIKLTLNLKIRNFIKKICTKPEDFTHEDWTNVGPQLSTVEKCQIILIATEARKKAELTYGLRSVKN